MKKIHLLLVTSLIIFAAHAQNYNNLLNYYYDGAPVNGVKIKTNIPFVAPTQMPTITIQGYNFGTGEPIGLTLVFYIYSGGSDFYNPANYYFYGPTITSSGAYTPPVYLSNEGGKVVIFINDLPYYQRFTVSAYAQGMSETSAQYSGWTVADEAISGTQTVLVPYKSRLAGNAFLPGNGIWSSNGNVGIGTTSPDANLTVNGTIHAKEVKVDLSVPGPDYVFEKNYKLKTLPEVNRYITLNKHLPEIPSAKSMEENGINVSELNMKLLKKVEELTLYLIEQNKEIADQRSTNQSQQKEINNQKEINQSMQKEIDELKKQFLTLIQSKP